MDERDSAVDAAMADIRRIEHDLGVTLESVAAIRDRLIELAEHRELFSTDDFPPPTPDAGANSYLYRIAQDGDDRFALYVQSTATGTSTPVHNHTTWAVVVGFDGRELNRFYERTETGVIETGSHVVEAGTGVAMLPDDLHAIHIDGRSLNFHCYGLALERLDRREYYSPIDRTWKIFANTSGIKEARPGLRTC